MFKFSKFCFLLSFGRVTHFTDYYVLYRLVFSVILQNFIGKSTYTQIFWLYRV